MSSTHVFVIAMFNLMFVAACHGNSSLQKLFRYANMNNLWDAHFITATDIITPSSAAAKGVKITAALLSIMSIIAMANVGSVGHLFALIVSLSMVVSVASDYVKGEVNPISLGAVFIAIIASIIVGKLIDISAIELFGANFAFGGAYIAYCATKHVTTTDTTLSEFGSRIRSNRRWLAISVGIMIGAIVYGYSIIYKQWSDKDIYFLSLAAWSIYFSLNVISVHIILVRRFRAFAGAISNVVNSLAGAAIVGAIALMLRITW